MSPADDEHYRYLAWHPPRAVPTRYVHVPITDPHLECVFAGFAFFVPILPTLVGHGPHNCQHGTVACGHELAYRNPVPVPTASLQTLRLGVS
ncbi:hypothetical protein IAQ61_011413 [Plenodomus lingam]|uniref:uncharacterized protein n=1 Tax=Leptosphaeria maculans TaxID=5022 RepID=UPI00332AE0F0|nr:hypothetical protein IAQ61_011413 [Plenodomus lingam]